MLFTNLMCISHFMFANDLFLAVYFIFILDYRNYSRQEAKSSHFFYLSSKWVINQWRQLTTSTMHLTQGLLMNIQCSSDTRNFARVTRALKTRSEVAGRWQLITTSWEDHRSWSSYNYMRSCQRTQRWPLYGHLEFETNWKGEKAWYMSAS